MIMLYHILLQAHEETCRCEQIQVHNDNVDNDHDYDADNDHDNVITYPASSLSCRCESYR